MNTVEKLEHLKTIVHNIPDGRLDLEYWRNGPVSDFDSWENVVQNCDSGCVLGWASADPIFQKYGFNFAGASPVYFPYYKGFRNRNEMLSDWDAVETFFDLSTSETHHIFMADSYPNGDVNTMISKDLVLEHIDWIIKCVKVFPRNYLVLPRTARIAFDPNIKATKLEDGKLEAELVVDCFDDFIPDGGTFQFVAYIKINEGENPVTALENYIVPNYPLKFGVKLNERMVDFLMNWPIVGIPLNWHKNLTSPFYEDFNTFLTHKIKLSLSAATLSL